MEDFAYIKKYKPIFNFCLELVFNIVFSFALFFVILVVFGLDSEGDKLFTFDLVLSLVIAGITFLSLLGVVIPGLIRKIKFNKNNPNSCVIKLDTINEKLYLTNNRTEIFFKDIIDFDYVKVSEREFFVGYSSLSNEKVIKKSINKSRIGNLRLKLKNGNIVVVERILDIENISKKLKSLLNK